MSNKRPLLHRFLVFILAWALVCIQFVPYSLANDQGIAPGETGTQPKVRPVTVTASVSDNENPSVPILVEPENKELLRTNKPTFIWKESTDNFGIDSYKLVLDGETYYDSIPTNDTENDDFELSYDSSTGEYSLVPKDSISDGKHTWKIIAVDHHGNTASSVTWTFTIDTTAPVFVITAIGSYETSISAQDLSTVPATPFVLKKNQPVLIGTGEAVSTVVLTARLPDGSTTTYEFTIQEDGSWEQQLEILPRDTLITLDFVITDPAGNVSVLTDVLLILRRQTVVIPPVITGPDKPVIEVPILPPKEVITEVITRVTTTYPATGTFVSLASTTLARQTTTISLTISWTDILVLLLVLFLPILKTILLAVQFGGDLSPELLSRIWRAIGLYDLFSATPQGIVLERSTNAPVSFAPIIFSGETRGKEPVREVTLSNANGVYAHIGLQEGTYRATVLDQSCLFPTPVPAPAHLNWHQHYVGVGFPVSPERPEPILVIPVEDTAAELKLQSRIKYAVLHTPMLSLLLAVISTVCSILLPSWVNILAATVYWLLLLYMSWRNRKPFLHGKIVENQKEPLNQVVVSLYSSESKWCYWITQTSRDGLYQLNNGATAADKLEIVTQNYSLPDAQSNQNTASITQEEQDKGYKDLVLIPAAESSCLL